MLYNSRSKSSSSPALFTWRTSSSTPWRTRYTSPHQSCITCQPIRDQYQFVSTNKRSVFTWRSRELEDHLGWGHTTESIWTVTPGILLMRLKIIWKKIISPLIRWELGTTEIWGCRGRLLRCCWCLDGRFAWWMQIWEVWRGSLWGSGCWGRTLLLQPLND